MTMPPILIDSVVRQSSTSALALLFRRDAARLGPEVRVELPMVGAGH
jgi:hypothetical protein